TTSRGTAPCAPARRACASAECSESTGTIWPGAAAASTSSPPTMRLSLLASASVAPVSSTARVAARPTEPVMPLSTTSASTSRASATASSMPSAVFATPVSAAWRASASALLPAASPTSSKRSGFAPMTSRAWVPIDPVDPRMMTRRRLMRRAYDTGSAQRRHRGEHVHDEDERLAGQVVGVPLAGLAVALGGRDHDDELGADLLPDEGVAEARDEAARAVGQGPAAPALVERLARLGVDAAVVDVHLVARAHLAAVAPDEQRRAALLGGLEVGRDGDLGRAVGRQLDGRHARDGLLRFARGARRRVDDVDDEHDRLAAGDVAEALGGRRDPDDPRAHGRAVHDVLEGGEGRGPTDEVGVLLAHRVARRSERIARRAVVGGVVQQGDRTGRDRVAVALDHD